MKESDELDKIMDELKDILDNTIFTVKQLKDALNKIPEERDNDSIGVWIDNNGTRHRILNIDKTVNDTIGLCLGELDPKDFELKVEERKFGNKDTIVHLPDKKMFYCECRCNVFRKSLEGIYYKCNSCGNIYEGIS
jgi:hypothetical protein